MIKAIIFDCFGVLTVDKWKEFVTTLPEDHKQAAKDINHSYDRGEITSTEFISEVESLTGRTPREVEKIVIGTDSANSKNSELLNYISQLKKDYKIGLLSNIASNWIRDTFLDANEVILFDNIVLSYEVHMTKPDPRIFVLTCKKLEVEPNEAVMVDDIETYCAAAKDIGMHAIQYKDFESMKKDLEEILTTSNN